MDLAVPKAQRQTAQELIATINPRVWLGHFELWDEGEIIFRHGMALMTGEQPSLAQAAAMIDVAVEAADRFFPAYDFLLRGAKTPQEAIAACMFETVGEALGPSAEEDRARRKRAQRDTHQDHLVAAAPCRGRCPPRLG
jgi:hypothetical protein